MGNICCGHDDEDYKHGAWYDNDDTEAETRHITFNDEDDDAEYNAKATDRERLILLHEKQKSTRRVPQDPENGAGAGRRGRKNRLTRLKRPSITSTPIDMTLASSHTFTPPSFPKSDETTKFLLDAMGGNFVFDSIGEDTKLQFVSAMQSQEFNEGDWVMHQGGVGDYFYIVEEGEVAFHVGGAESTSNTKDPNNLPPQVGTGSKGSTFGELALLYNTPRAASIRALTSLKLYKIDQHTFRSLLLSNQLQSRSNIISLVENLSTFKDLDENKIQKLVDAFTIMEFAQGERIVNKGDQGNVLYIVKSGQVKVDDIGHGNSRFQDQILEEGGCFGERALITGETRAANVTAAVQSTLLSISKQGLEEIMGPLDQAIMHSSYSKYLSSIPLFEYLERDEIDRCVKHLKEEIFEKGDKILAKGKLHLIQEGHGLMMMQEKAKTGDDGHSENGVNDKKIATGPKLVKLEKGDYFGNVWEESGQDGSAVTVEEKMKTLALTMSDVQSVTGDLTRLDPANSEQGDKAQPNHSSKMSGMSRLLFMKSQSSSFDCIKTKKKTTNRDVMNLSKLKKHRILGVGTFGKVWLVTPKSNTKDKPTPYALKMVSKRQILEQQLAPAVMREKNVMESIQHPFLCHMVSGFQDENYLYFVMDLILGGELFELIYEDGKKGNTDNAEWKESAFYKSFGTGEDKPMKGVAGVGVRQALFYGAGVIEAFGYLHNRRIVYRDLKPENVMLNEKGYCVVVDMGFAKVVVDKTYTVCGTLEYLAPEVIANKGHNHAADYWSFACLLYELIVGQTPFIEPGLDQLSLLKKIVKAQYSFPAKIDELSPDSANGLEKALCHWKDLISRLLKPRSVERLGNLRNGIEDILDHDWFGNIDFNEFRTQSMPAPWVPIIADPLDTSHFGNNFGREEKPERFRRKLTDKDQEIFRGF